MATFRLRLVSRVAAAFTKRPVTIEAVQLESEEYVDTLEGRMRGNPGDWKVTGVDGEQYFVAKGIFCKTYEPSDDQAKEAWSKAYGDVPQIVASVAVRAAAWKTHEEYVALHQKVRADQGWEGTVFTQHCPYASGSQVCARGTGNSYDDDCPRFGGYEKRTSLCRGKEWFGAEGKPEPHRVGAVPLKS